MTRSTSFPGSAASRSDDSAPAFYLLRPGGWRDYYNLLHLPYTVWHLSYVAIGAALVPGRRYGLLGWTLLAFLLAMGLSAHALDEWRSRPLRTTIPGPVLLAIGIAGTAIAGAIGLAVGVPATVWVLPLILVGSLLVATYNLELGPFHHDLVFAGAWGAFPLLTSYVVQTGGLSASAILLALAAAVLSLAQRRLSTRARLLRRSVKDVRGELEYVDGHAGPVTRRWLVQDEERALMLLSAAMPLLAIGLLLG